MCTSMPSNINNILEIVLSSQQTKLLKKIFNQFCDYNARILMDSNGMIVARRYSFGVNFELNIEKKSSSLFYCMKPNFNFEMDITDLLNYSDDDEIIIYIDKNNINTLCICNDYSNIGCSIVITYINKFDIIPKQFKIYIDSSELIAIYEKCYKKNMFHVS